MALLQIWQAVPGSLANFGIDQVVKVAGDGILRDDSECSTELRQYLTVVTTGKLAEYAAGCLDTKLETRGFALQDIVNEMGRRPGFKVENGRYRGVPSRIGFDGLWESPEGHACIIEVKTSDTYSINLDTIADYRAALLVQGRIGARSSMLVVVGNADTGSLEAQVRGSRHAWDMRLISVRSLADLVRLHEVARSQLTATRIRTLLTPLEFTRLDALADVLLLAAEETADAREQQLVSTAAFEADGLEADASTEETAEQPHPAAPKQASSTDPAAIAEKRSRIIRAVERRTGVALVKRSRAAYSSDDKRVRLVCTVSKRYLPPRDAYPYWYAYHPNWRDFLLGGGPGFLALGFIDADKVAIIPASFIEGLLPAMNTTTRPNGETYWHIHLLETADGGLGIRLRERPPADLGEFTTDLAVAL